MMLSRAQTHPAPPGPPVRSPPADSQSAPPASIVAPRHRISRHRRKTIHPNLHVRIPPLSKCSHTRHPPAATQCYRDTSSDTLRGLMTRGPMRRTLRRAIVVLALLPAALTLSAQKRLITERDLFDFNWIGDIQLSPSRQIRRLRPGLRHPRPLRLPDRPLSPRSFQYRRHPHPPHPRHPRHCSPLLTPTATQLAFLRAVEKEGKPTPAQLYLMPATPGASPIKLTDLPKGASSPQWSPSGQAPHSSSPPPHRINPKPNSTPPSKPAPPATPPTSRTSGSSTAAIWRSNGEGYLDPSFVSQLYLVSLPEARRLARTLPGSSPRAASASRTTFGAKAPPGSSSPPSHIEESIYDEFPHNTVSTPSTSATSPPSPIPKTLPPPAFTLDLKLDAGTLALSPDGNHLAFHAQAEGPPHHLPPGRPISGSRTSSGPKNPPNPSAPPRNLTEAKGYEMGSGVGGDNTAPRGGGRPWPPLVRRTPPPSSTSPASAAAPTCSPSTPHTGALTPAHRQPSKPSSTSPPPRTSVHRRRPHL